MTRYGTPIVAVGLIFALSTTVDAAAQDTVTLHQTDWAALSDASVYHYEWYDPADLDAIRAWVNGDAKHLPDMVSYPLVVQDENGVYRPNGAAFYPQEVFWDSPYGFGPDPSNWIDDPGTFDYWYYTPGWPGENWWFVHPYHLYGIIQQEAPFQEIDPAAILTPADLARYKTYKKKRDRLERLRARYRKLMRKTFDRYDYDRILEAMEDHPTGTVVLDGHFYIGRTLSNGEPGQSRYPHFPYDKPADVPDGGSLWPIDWEFSGTLRGEHDASIQTLPGATFEAPVMVVFGFDPALGTAPASLTIADLTFALTEPNTQFEHHGQPANYGTILAIPARTKEVHVTLDHVEASGLISDEIYGGYPGVTPLFGITAGRTIGGSVDLHGVTVRNTTLPVFPSFLVDSTFTMTDGLLENNLIGLSPYWLQGTTVDLSYNTTNESPLFSNWGPWEDPDVAPNSYHLHNNDMHLSGTTTWAAIELDGFTKDYVNFAEPEVLIEYNTVDMPGQIPPTGPIVAIDTNNVVVRYNTFTGAADADDWGACIWLDALDHFWWGWPTSGHGWQIYGNDFDGFDGIDVLLGSGQSNSEVTYHPGDVVVDEGQDNILIQDPPQ